MVKIDASKIDPVALNSARLDVLSLSLSRLALELVRLAETLSHADVIALIDRWHSDGDPMLASIARVKADSIGHRLPVNLSVVSA